MLNHIILQLDSSSDSALHLLKSAKTAILGDTEHYTGRDVDRLCGNIVVDILLAHELVKRR